MDFRPGSRSACRCESSSFGGRFLEADNFEPANPGSTPEHIAPVWYFTLLRHSARGSRPTPGRSADGVGRCVIPVSALDRPLASQVDPLQGLDLTRCPGPVRNFVRGTGYLGVQPAEGKYVIAARLFSVLYFAFFWLMPLYSKIDRVTPVTERLSR